MEFVSLIEVLCEILNEPLIGVQWRGASISTRGNSLINMAGAAQTLYALLHNNPTQRPKWRKINWAGNIKLIEEGRHEDGMEIIHWLSGVASRPTVEKDKTRMKLTSSEMTEVEKEICVNLYRNTFYTEDAEAIAQGHQIGFDRLEIEDFLKLHGIAIYYDIAQIPNKTLAIRNIVLPARGKIIKANELIELIVDEITPKRFEFLDSTIKKIFKVESSGNMQYLSYKDQSAFERLIGKKVNQTWYEQATGITPEKWGEIASSFEENKKIEVNKFLSIDWIKSDFERNRPPEKNKFLTVDWTVFADFNRWSEAYALIRLRSTKDLNDKLRSDIEEGRVKAIDGRGLLINVLSENTWLEIDEAQKFIGAGFKLIEKKQDDCEDLPTKIATSTENNEQTNLNVEKKLTLDLSTFIDRMGGRDDLIKPLIEKAIVETNSYNPSIVFNMLREWANAEVQPLRGITEDGLKYSDHEDQITYLTKKQLTDRIRRIKKRDKSR